MNPAGGLGSRLFAFGHCRRCTRLSAIAAAVAATVALAALLILGRSVIAYGAVVVAIAATALWTAHRISAGRTGTLYTLLRAFGAAPRDAKAIAAILGPSLEADGSGSARLPQGVTVNVTRGTRPGRARDGITRVVLMRGQDIVAGAVAAEPVGFRSLGPTLQEH